MPTILTLTQEKLLLAVGSGDGQVPVSRGRAEEQFGMTPLAQLRLGVTFLQERSLAASLKVPREGGRPVEC